MKKNLLVVAENNNTNFLTDLIPVFQTFFEVKIANVHNSKELSILYEWADVIWLEWAAKMAIEISKRKKDKYIILRLHSYEYFCEFYKDINWINVDNLILVAENIERNILNKNNIIHSSTNVNIIHNSVDTSLFNLRKGNFNKNLALVTTIRHCKNLPFIIQLFTILVRLDPNYKLHIAGDYQSFSSPHIKMENSEIDHYIKHILKELQLEEHIMLHGPVHDINSWLEDKSYIVSTSIREAMPVNILEGMSKGLMPVIHNFPGAKDLYPNEYIFNTVDEFLDIIMNSTPDPFLYRSIIVDRYRNELINLKYIKLLESLPFFK